MTIRLTAISSGAMAIAGNQYDGLSLPLKSLSISQNNYAYLYTGSAGLWYAGMLTLEYDGEFVPVRFGFLRFQLLYHLSHGPVMITPTGVD